MTATTTAPRAAAAERTVTPVRRPLPRRPGRGLRVVAVVVVALLFALPILWMLLTSVSADGDVYQFPPRLWPTWQWSNYARAWNAAPWPRYFGNTVLIAGSVVVLVLLTSLLAGFAFAIMRFRGRTVLFLVVMSVLMVPQTVLLIPNFVIAQRLGLYDTYLIQILPWGASVFGIFLLRQFFVTLPRELFEAAEIDGAGPVRMLFSVAAPLAAPSLVLVALNAFMGSWNAFVWPFIMTRSDEVRPIEVGLQTFYSAEGTDWTALCAAVTFTTLPIIVLFLFLQRYFVAGAYGTQGKRAGMTTCVEFFGGLRVIGSSKIMVSTPSARVLLDMGLDMPGRDDLFTSPVQERPGHRLRDRLAVGAAPAMPGIYDPAQLPPGSPLARPDPRPAAIFLSHTHLDHDGALDFARSDVPVHAHPDAVRMAAAIAVSGTGVTRVPTAMHGPVHVGDLRVEAVPVDHDVPGACGLLVHAPDGVLAYTGDLNFHRGARSAGFVRAAAGAAMLVTETTMLSFDPAPEEPRSEAAVLAVASEAFAAAPGIALVSMYERDVDRAQRLIYAARSLGRTVVWPGQQATLLAHVGVAGVTTWDASRPQRPPHREAVARLAGPALREVGLAEVVAAPSAFVVQPDVDDAPALLDLPRHDAGYLPFVHAQGAPMGPFAAGWAGWHRWLDALGITYVAAGSSGHATGAALHEMVTDIHPGVVVPIHGFRPEALVVDVPTVLAEYGVRYGLDGRAEDRR